ncbi:NAD(+) synthase [Treponema sp.]|uniref:NAD(+) synthase n=1 Tax=Treponema sp. TaxID=166 RepID=UPI003F06E5DB
MNYGFFRVAAASPALSVADCGFNAGKIIEIVKKAEAEKVQLLVFPELSICGYTCADLFAQKALLCACYDSLKEICRETKEYGVLFCVGLPVEYGAERFNCAVFIHRGKILAAVPKTFIPNYSEFYESRWFSSFSGKKTACISICPGLESIPFGTDIIIQDSKNPSIAIAAELCEDLWVPLSPSTRHALNGATIIANLSASNEVAGKADYRRMLVAGHSAKTVSAYIYANAGHDESSTDMVFSGHSIIAANGTVQAESGLFDSPGKLLIADIDIEKITQDRLRSTTFTNSFFPEDSEYKIIFAENLQPDNSAALQTEKLYTVIEPQPFVPADTIKRKDRCFSIIEMQSEGLAKRLRHIKCENAVIGISGGLDSTLALLVCARAFDKCGLPRKNILSVTMPAFGTTDRTFSNACKLAEETQTTLKQISIADSVIQHFKDIGHDIEIQDVTYENGQARERTQVLMDLANKCGGIVIGTGDLSELALGWCTYNGDQMSMYGVNSSIPKTLVRHLVSWFSEEALEKGSKNLSMVLNDILATPVSPELLPPSDGKISQKTEEIVGPYELHDFFLYYVLRWGFSPRKIYFLAQKAFLGKRNPETNVVYTNEIILKWLKNFYRRFFSQQFKRSCMPDGAKVGTVNLSPRGDWRMPSDASAAIWLKEIEEC